MCVSELYFPGGKRQPPCHNQSEKKSPEKKKWSRKDRVRWNGSYLCMHMCVNVPPNWNKRIAVRDDWDVGWSIDDSGEVSINSIFDD